MALLALFLHKILPKTFNFERLSLFLMFVSCVLIFPIRPETWETSVGKLLFRLLAVCFSLEMRRGFYEARHLKLEIGTRRRIIRLDPSPFRPYRALRS